MELGLHPGILVEVPDAGDDERVERVEVDGLPVPQLYRHRAAPPVPPQARSPRHATDQ